MLAVTQLGSGLRTKWISRTAIKRNFRSGALDNILSSQIIRSSPTECILFEIALPGEVAWFFNPCPFDRCLDCFHWVQIMSKKHPHIYYLVPLRRGDSGRELKVELLNQRVCITFGHFLPNCLSPGIVLLDFSLFVVVVVVIAWNRGPILLLLSTWPLPRGILCPGVSEAVFCPQPDTPPMDVPPTSGGVIQYLGPASQVCDLGSPTGSQA